MSIRDKKILLVGCGKMGNALYEGWIKSEIPQENIFVVEPFNKNIKSKNLYNNIQDFLADNSFETIDICVFAIKPQNFPETLKNYFLPQKTLVISIGAGVTISKINSLLPVCSFSRKIARVMPNLPASIGFGVNGYFCNSNCDELDKKNVYKLFIKCGSTYRFESEEEIDKITALSGSGPAYFYYFIEAFAKKAENFGFSKDIANDIAEQTAIGAIELLKNSGRAAKQLREDVTSPKGTTEAGLLRLMDGELQKILDETIDKAFIRAKELGTDSK